MDPDVIAAIVWTTVIVGGIFAFQFWRESAKKKRQWEIDSIIPVCPHCVLKLDPGARFCRQCRATDLTNLAQLKKDRPFAALEKALKPLVQAGEAYIAKDRLYEAREIYDLLAQCVFCENCQEEYPPDSPYCSTCGRSTVPFSRELIFKWLHTEKPHIVVTEEDFRRIERTPSPVFGKTGRAAVALSKFVAKKAGVATFKLGKAAAKSAIQHALASANVPIPPPKRQSSPTPPVVEFKFSCPNCGQNILVDAHFAGLSAACPNCSNQLIIPSPDELT